MANSSTDDLDDTYEYESVDVEPVSEDRSKMKVRARAGHQFQSQVPDVPLITPEGVDLTVEQAEAVLAEDSRTGVLFVEPVSTEGEGS